MTHPTRIAAFCLWCWLLAPVHGGVPVCDTFDDGVIDRGWMVIGSDLAIIGPVEQNGHLEFPAAASDADGAFGGVVSLWTLDALQDFRIRVDRTINPPGAGEVGMSFAVVFDDDPRVLTTGITMDIGEEDRGPFACVALLVDDNETEVCELPVAGNTMYIWYDAANDVISASYVGFDDDDAPSAGNLRTLADTDRVNVYLGAFAGNNAPAVAGSDLYYDDFCIDEGVMLPAGGLDEDINDDGMVDVLDLVQIIVNWGPCDPAPCPADVNGDGVVDVLDLVAVIVAWGG